jgi:hypothetical protein
MIYTFIPAENGSNEHLAPFCPFPDGSSKVDPTRHQTGLPGLLIQALRQLMPRGLPLDRLEDVDLKMLKNIFDTLTSWMIWFRNVRCT